MKSLLNFILENNNLFEVRLKYTSQNKKELSSEELAKKETDSKIKKIYNEIKKIEDLAEYYRNEMENDPEVIATTQRGDDPGNIKSANEYNKISDKILNLYKKIED